MSCYSNLPPMGDPQETLNRLCQEAATVVIQDADLTERERGLLVCILGIREFGRAVLRSMDDEGQVFFGFEEDFPGPLLIPASKLWESVEELTECILDGIGELERYDPDAVARRREIQALLDSLWKDPQGYRRPD